MMEKVVSRRSKKFARKLKSGERKEYTTETVTIPLSSDDPFQDEEHVVVLGKQEYFDLMTKLKELESVDPEKFEELSLKVEDLRKRLDKKSDKIDKLQTKLTDTLERQANTWALVAFYREVMLDVDKLNLWDRIRGRLPKSYKQLQEQEELVEGEDVIDVESKD